MTDKSLGIDREGSTTNTGDAHPIPYRIVVAPCVPPLVRRERIAAGTPAICIWCLSVEPAGTLITVSHWDLGVPKAHAIFICNPCFLSIAAGDQEYIEAEGLAK